MTLSAAEKQRRYRARRDANPELSIHTLKRNDWHGNVKSINANPAGTISEQPDQVQKTPVFHQASIFKLS